MRLKEFSKVVVSLLTAAFLATLALSCSRPKTESTNEAQTIEVSYTATESDTQAVEPLFDPTPDISWFTQNPNARRFEISTADQLAGLAVIVNGMAAELHPFDFSGRTITLTSDIDLSEYGRNSKFNSGNGWIPIAADIENCDKDGCNFAGVFDGNGKTIRNLFTTSNYDNKSEHFGDQDNYHLDGGVFGAVFGTIKNLGVIDAHVEASGGIAGMLRGEQARVSNSYFIGTVKGGSGIVGEMVDGSISNSYFNGTINGSGGIVGLMSGGSISNCYSTGNISGGFGVGGIVGRLSKNGSVSNCYSAANVSGNGSVGGIVGYVYNLAMTREHNNIRSRRAYTIRWCGDCAETEDGCNDCVNEFSGGKYNAALSQDSFISQMKAIRLFDTLRSNITNTAALNASVKLSSIDTTEYYGDMEVDIMNIHHLELASHYGGDFDDIYSLFRRSDTSFTRGGRVVGGNNAGMLSNNVAFIGITDIHGGTNWSNRNARSINGADITAEQIRADGTIGGRFTRANGWTTQNGRLPGLFGQTVEMPEHLR